MRILATPTYNYATGCSKLQFEISYGALYILTTSHGFSRSILFQEMPLFAINVWLTVNDPVHVDAVRHALAEAVRLSRVEDGCERYDVYHSESDPLRFLLVEHWASKADWESHRERHAFQAIYKPQVLPRVNREAHVATLVE